jgi:hypothetical protein
MCVTAHVSQQPARGVREVAVVHRHVVDDEHVECGYDTTWDPSADDWTDALDRWSRVKGELFFFDDAKVVWGEDEPRSAYAPASRRGQHRYHVIERLPSRC